MARRAHSPQIYDSSIAFLRGVAKSIRVALHFPGGRKHLGMESRLISGTEDIMECHSRKKAPLIGSSQLNPDIKSFWRKHLAKKMTGVVHPLGSKVWATVDSTERLVHDLGGGSSLIRYVKVS
ncbi:unnamed protein product [Parnassius apollo]|uniref:(apollo) hypothetical protein n=1 Tax=Parnassius apollo TaxID=110799 RepID=A0A8S3XIE2_PARAO|nr:unnamed protein product [Parnassius apollo]